MKKITLILASLLSVALVSCSNTTPVDIGLNPVLFDKNFPDAFPYQNSTTQVISPYKPHNIIDIKGIKPGHLARDVSTAEIDSKTGKPIIFTAKIFRVPAVKTSN